MQRRSRRSSVAIVAAMVVALTTAGCSGATTAAGCSEPQMYNDPRNTHILTGEDVEYDIYPPTSGPHSLDVPEPGMHTEAIPGPNQVAALEQGMVIFTLSESVSADDRKSIESLAGQHADKVIVHPADREISRHSELAITAWGVRELCNGFDVTAAESFIAEYGDAFTSDH